MLMSDIPVARPEVLTSPCNNNGKSVQPDPLIAFRPYAYQGVTQDWQPQRRGCLGTARVAKITGNLTSIPMRTKPAYVKSFKDRHGHQRHYFRHPDLPDMIPLPGEIGSDRFVHAYEYATSLLDKFEHAKMGRMTPGYGVLPPEAGVYFLVRDGKITYIGTSSNMRNRVSAHSGNGRAFDKAYYIRVHTEQERIELEGVLIATMQPVENKAHKPDLIRSIAATQRLRLRRSGTGVIITNDAGDTQP